MRVFVSYARVDSRLVKDWIVKKLRRRCLDRRGHDVWFDEHLSAGENWQKQLFAEIERSEAVVYCTTPEANASEWCQRELDHAIANNKPIFPVLLQARTPLPDKLKNIQFVDFTDGPTRQAVARLLTGLQQVQQTSDLSANTVEPGETDVNADDATGNETPDSTIPDHKAVQKTKFSDNKQKTKFGNNKLPARSILAAVSGFIIFAVTIFGVLPDATRNAFFVTLGILEPTPSYTSTITMTPTPTVTPTPTPTSTLITPRAYEITVPGTLDSVTTPFTVSGTYNPDELAEDELWIFVVSSGGSDYYPQVFDCQARESAVVVDTAAGTWQAEIHSNNASSDIFDVVLFRLESGSHENSFANHSNEGCTEESLTSLRVPGNFGFREVDRVRVRKQ